MDGKKFNVKILNAQDIKIPEFFNELAEDKPDLFLIDLDLSAAKDSIVFSLSGASTSNILREKFPNIPIIIFTSKDIIQNKYPSIEQLVIGIDEIIFKDVIRKNIKCYVRLLFDLIAGYKKIQEKNSNKFDDLLALLKAPMLTIELIKLADPPLIQDKEISSYLIAKWIRKNILNYPGILYDPINAATLLGISEKAFLSDEIQQTFASAKYQGIFRPIEGRWWKPELNILAMKKLNDSEKEFALRDGFPLAWDRSHSDGHIERSRCIFSCESPAEWVCCILKKPMMIKYSLAYRSDSRPKIMDEARVSYKAIKTSNDFKAELLADPSGLKMLSNIYKTKGKRC